MDLYESTQYNHSSENKTILLDISGNTTTTFSKELTSKLILDEEYEIYFESITTFKTKVNTGLNDVSFLLKFDDLNIKVAHNTTNQNLSANKILIPNNCSSNGGTSVSKSKKMNFICSILPTNISKINFSLTNLNNETIFTTDDGRSIIELLCIPKNKKKSETDKINKDLYENTRYLSNDNNKHLIINLDSELVEPITEDFSGASAAGGGTGFSGSWSNSDINLDYTGLNEDLFDTGTWSQDISNYGNFNGNLPGSGIRPSGQGTYSLLMPTGNNNRQTTIGGESQPHTHFNSLNSQNGTNSSTHYFSFESSASGMTINLIDHLRYIRTKNINSILKNATKITIDYIIGSDNNGGGIAAQDAKFGINILSSVNGSYRTQTPTDTSQYQKRESNSDNTYDFNFLIEGEGYTTDSNYVYASEDTGGPDEWKRISFCSSNSGLEQTSTYPHVYVLPGLGENDANYLEFICRQPYGATHRSRNHYAIKYLSIETPHAPYSTNFSINLNEPLIINKKSEIYLDNIIYTNPNLKNDINNMGLLLNIEEFEIDNIHNTGNNLDSNKILLPNENTINSNVTTNTYTENLNGLGDELPGENVSASQSGISGSFVNTQSTQVNLDFVGFNSDLFDTGTWSEDISNINGAFSDASSGSVPTGDGTGVYRSLDVEEYTNDARFTNFYSKNTENGTNSSTHYISLSGPSPRYVRTKSINDILSIASKVTIDYIIGDGSNGGDLVDDGDHFGINILSAINGSSRTQTPTDTSLYKKRVSSFTNTNNFNFLIETRGGRNSSDTDIYGHGSGYTDDGEFKRISFCPVGSSIATPSSDLSTTYPAVYELPGLGTADANYLEFISIGSGGYLDPYAVKFISIETSITTNTNINKTLKSKKYNYISTIRPKVIKNISGNITNLNNTTIVNSADSRLIMDFLIKPCL